MVNSVRMGQNAKKSETDKETLAEYDAKNRQSRELPRQRKT